MTWEMTDRQRRLKANSHRRAAEDAERAAEGAQTFARREGLRRAAASHRESAAILERKIKR
jgi:hypothetical protein